jgi:hypothetical protein
LSSDHKRKAGEELEVAISNGDDRKPKKNKHPISSLDPSMALSMIATDAAANAAAGTPVNNMSRQIAPVPLPEAVDPSPFDRAFSFTELQTARGNAGAADISTA